MKLNCGFLLFLTLITLDLVDAQRKVPSQKDIDDYDDPVLREIFKTKTQPQRFEPDSSLQTQRVVYPQQPQRVVYPQQPQGPYTQVQTQTPSIYQPEQYPYYSQNPQQPSGRQDLTNLAAQGAMNFYSGAQRVSQAFGLQQYQNQYVNYAAGLFG
ncbi:hypothetical protein FO519_004235 [Halicephalobus sp. NKZ332]|nr:hypothetical protein FO519_004235 [Halicephalobus sp. NKZ332]